MLKFFRKIRQQLLLENSFSKYLLYAVGEIALVMIGILLALQVNNWNEQQKFRLTEQQLLQDLHQEFQSNQQLLLKKQKDMATAIGNNEAYFQKLIAGTQTYTDMVNYNHEVAMAVGTSDPTFGVIKSLIASGDIKLISNNDLKYLLTSWQDYMADFNENEKIHLDNFFHYADYTRVHLPQPTKQNGEVGFYDLSPQKVEKRYLEMAEDIPYRNYIQLNIALMNSQVLPKLEYVLGTCNQIIQLIEAEIEK